MNYVVQRIENLHVRYGHTRTAREHYAHCALLRKGFPLHPCMARAILAYTGKHYNVANTLFLFDAFTHVDCVDLSLEKTAPVRP